MDAQKFSRLDIPQPDPRVGRLQSTLRQLMRSGWHSNAAMRSIIDDYARYHVVLVVAGSLVAVAFLAASAGLWRRFRKITAENGGSSYERKVCLGFAASGAVAGVLVGLLAAVNATNVFDPLNGFSGVVDALPSHDGPLRQSFNQWLRSGASTPPRLVASVVHHRVLFQATKAGVCAVVFIVLALLCVRLWRASVRWSNRGDLANSGPGKLVLGATISSGMLTAGLALLVLVVVVANLQGALAPTALTLAFGPI
jgi:hypothetical protein